ncbi:MAG: hypothetical protein GDA65_11110 [Nitrospira sp. CR1.1]|jgi:hypothetical protein|nr:hypothetical protein [Nitrospira sp. CR1.1]
MVLAAFVIACYMLLLSGLAVAAPGIGLGGSLIELVPGNWRDGAHVPAYGLLAWLVMWGLLRRGWPVIHAACIGILATGVFGLWTEVAQGAAPGREASLHDVGNDLLGGMIAAALMLWQERALTRSKRCMMLPETNRDHLMKGTGSR